jgi:hypothetical protein
MTKFVEIKKINDCKAESVVGGTLNIGLWHKKRALSLEDLLATG